MSDCHDHTTGSSNMMLVNGASVAGVDIWTETVTVTPNTNYAFSTWIEAVSTANPALLQFSINGKGIGSPITAPLPTCTWAQFYTTWNSGSSTTATISILNQNTQVQGNDFALDDISFAPLVIKQDSVTITVDTPGVRTGNDTTICNTASVQLNASGGATYTWIPSTGLSNAAIANPKATPSASTQYIVAGTTVHGCTAKDTVFINVNPLPTVVTSNDTTICHNTSTQLSAQGGMIYSWSPASGLDNASISNPVASPVQTTGYMVTVTDNNLCTDSSPVKITVQQIPAFTVSGDTTACLRTPVQLKATGGNVYSWSPATGLDNPASATPVATPPGSITYEVQVVETTCHDSALLATSIDVLPIPDVTVQKSNDIDCTHRFALLSCLRVRNNIYGRLRSASVIARSPIPSANPPSPPCTRSKVSAPMVVRIMIH